MLKGLQEVEQELRASNVPFHLLMGDAATNISEFAFKYDAALVVTDFQSLRVPRKWIENVATLLDKSKKKIPLVQVDAHNVVPCWYASPKLEYSARTIRSKIQAKLGEFLSGCEKLKY